MSKPEPFRVALLRIDGDYTEVFQVPAGYDEKPEDNDELVNRIVETIKDLEYYITIEDVEIDLDWWLPGLWDRYEVHMDIGRALVAPEAADELLNRVRARFA